MDSQNIILLFQRGHLICSPEMELQIKMQITYHLEVLQRRFLAKEFDENFIENLNETYFVNLDNGQTLDDTTIKYAEVVFGCEFMTMVDRISRGHHATIEALILIFSYENRKHPIQSLLDDISRVSYRMGPKAWINQTILAKYFLKPHAY